MLGLPAGLADALAEPLGSAPVQARAVSGGDINDAFRVDLTDGRSVFVKTRADPPVGFFTAEADGLERLAATGTVRVPEVLAVDDEVPYLALTWIDRSSPSPRYDDELGRGLAALHLAPTDATFGLDRDNFVGTVTQENSPAPENTWADFFAERRLRPFAELAIQRGALPAEARGLVARVVDRLPELLGPPEPPSLLHGDLWGGNAMADERGAPVLVDPAVFRGHREVDLAMMRLFGGFSARVFAAYAEAAPLADGHEDRVRLHQLPPLLVHAILFGSGYGASVLDVLRTYA